MRKTTSSCHDSFAHSGCAALACCRPNCRCHFCAFCLEDCGDNAHAHVKTCKHRPSSMADDYFSSIGQFEHEQRQRRKRMAQHFVDQQPIPIRQLLLDACRQEFLDLGIHIECHEDAKNQVKADHLLALQLQQEDQPEKAKP